METSTVIHCPPGSRRMMSGSGSAPSEFEKLWTLWHPRWLILLSCVFQVALMLLGMLRKRSASPVIQFFTWLCYIAANGISYLTIVFPFANQSITDFRLVALWATFSLLHSGGIDTLNAFHLEDNRLWKRYALGFIFKTVVCVSVVAQCSPHGEFMVAVLLVLIVAICNYCERIWVHRRGSMDGLRESSQSYQELETSPQPDYPTIMDEKLRLERSGHLTTQLRVRRLSTFSFNHSFLSTFPPSMANSVEVLMKSNWMHHRYRRHYENGRFCSDDREYNHSIFGHMSYSEAFQIAETEMCLMHDEIYSRAPALHRRWGLITRHCFFILIIISTFIFLVFVNKSDLPVLDVIVTYVLFIFDLFVRVLGLFHFWFSYQNVIGIINYIGNTGSSVMEKVSLCLIKLTLLFRPVNSSCLSMGQFDFWGCCLAHQPSRFKRCVQLIGLNRELENYSRTKYVPISNELRDSIFQVLKDKSTQAKEAPDYKWYTQSRGEWALTLGNCSELGWSVVSSSLGQSLCIWIIATNLYHASQGSEVSALLKMAKHLSDYLLYLLKVNPGLLSSVTPDSVNICNDTIEELRSFFPKKGPFDKNDRKEASLLILKQCTDDDPRRVRGDQMMSELWHGCILAQQLRKLDRTDKDMTLVRVLVELLTHIAVGCRGELHAELLAGGLELVTVVWWIAFQLGLSQSYEFESGAIAITVVPSQNYIYSLCAVQHW
ncbi:hypothetical protein F0562_005808 [Nyssa sinensis]|uniref:DUF4220 domain-containing protein n=1 Tax=Nyssa sinensis TaxID=561372 RepID=A0A5J5ALN3_9ASTE|nr:hypothetical protein F0562_005808 [Nyssa sinensis]